MRLIRTVGPAAALLFAAALGAQTAPPAGGTAPPPTAPGAGGKTPAPTAPGAGGTGGAKLVFPTDPARAGTSTVPLQFPTNLFQVPDVARSLSLTDAQLNRLNAVTGQVQNQFRDQFGRLATASDAERAALALQLDREFSAAWLAGARDVLDARQLARYQQLQAQFGGFATLADPAIQRQLHLTDAQLRALNGDLTWRDQQMRDMMRQAALDRARAVQMFNDFNRASQDRMNQLLTAEQMRQWAQMTGEPFAFPPPFAMTPFGTAAPGFPAGAPGATGPAAGGGAVPPAAPGAGGPAQTPGPTTGGPTPPKR